MNRMTLRVLFVLLAAGLMLTAASCKLDTPETEPAIQTQPTEITEPTETQPLQTEPAETEPVETEPAEERFTLTFVGDCTLGSDPKHYKTATGFIETIGEDYEFPFRNVASYFENDDFTIINLEGVLCDGGQPANKSFTFRGPPSYINILTENSVEAVTLANNHTMDYGQTAYDATKTLLEEAGIVYVEKKLTAITTTESGLTIGLCAANFSFSEDTLRQQIADLREHGAQIVIFAIHWGTEGSYRPTSYQIKLAHAVIDAGADIVWGNHPHVLQPIEEYNGGIIFYSLGNFSFGGNAHPLDYDTALIQQEVIRDQNGNVTLGELTIVPASVSSVSDRNNFQPTPYAQDTEEYNRAMSKLDGTWTGHNLKLDR